MQFDVSFYLIDHRLLALLMVAVLAVACEIGYRAGSRRQGSPESLRSLMSGIGAAMLGILGLLLGFTLSMAIARWDSRRDVIVSESNAIGTVWLRAGLLDEPLCGELRNTLLEYTETRIALGGSRSDLDSIVVAQEQGEELHERIWSVVERANQPDTSNAVLSTLVVAANDVIDLHELRIASIENFLPATLILLLPAIAAVAVAFLAWSFGAASERGRTAMLFLTLLICAVLLLIMDVNRPQRGRIGVGVDALLRLQETITESTP